MWPQLIRNKFFLMLSALTAGLFLVPVFCLAEQKPLIITQVQIAGDKTNYDFIEIYNPQNADLNLDNYKLKKKSKTGKEYSIKSFAAENIIPAGGYYLWACSEDGYDQLIKADAATTQTLASNNSIAILDSDGKIIDALAWGEELENPFVLGTPFSVNPEPNQSLQRKKNANGFYQDTNINTNDFEINLTPLPKNSSFKAPAGEVPAEEELPRAPLSPGASSLLVVEAGADIFALVGSEVQFDGSSSYTNSYRPLTYFWNFGDGTTSDEKQPKHTYKFPGKYLVSLTVSDTLSSKTDTLTATIFQEGLSINEFLPIPAKAEGSAWIELYNASEQIIALENWQLTNKKQTSKFIFPSGSLIAPKQLLVLTEPISKISFNISDDSLSLVYPNGAIAQLVEYEETKMGWSINRMSDEKYIWSATPTPGLTNLITILPLAGQKVSQLKEEITIGQATEPALEPAKNYQTESPALTVETPTAEDLTSVSEWPPAPDSQRPGQTPSSQGAEPTDASASESQKPLASLAETKTTQNKTAKLILSISVALSFVILAGWAMLMLKKAVKK